MSEQIDRRWVFASVLQGELQGVTLIQKFVWLLQKRADVSRYQFTPGDFGPHSKELRRDTDELWRKGWINVEERLNDDGLVQYHFSMSGKLRQWVRDFEDDDVPGELLVKGSVIRNEYENESLRNILDDIAVEDPEMFRPKRVE